MTEQTLREQLCLIGRLIHDRQYAGGTGGSISARLSDDHILATPGGMSKGFLSPDQLLVVTLGGELVDPPANAGLRPTSELPMHLECYRQRPDVGGVVHAHPPTAVALTIAGVDLARPILPESLVLLGLVPTASYATPGTVENRDAIHDLIREHDAIMLAHHGSLTVATDVWTAYLRLETLEQYARVLHLAEQAGGARALPARELEKLIAIREGLGLMRPGDHERFQAQIRAQAGQAGLAIDPGS